MKCWTPAGNARTKHNPRLHSKQCGQQVRVGGSIPLLCPCESPPGPSAHERLLRCVQVRVMKMVVEIEYFCNKDRLRAGIVQARGQKAFSSLRGVIKRRKRTFYMGR